MNDVTRDMVCLIYSLMHDNFYVNIGIVIFLVMRKALFYYKCRYSFDGLLARFLRDHGVEKEALNYRPVADTKPMYMSRTQVIIMTHGPVFTIPD